MQGQGVGADTGRTSQEAAGRLFSQAVWHQHHGKPNEAVRLYKQVLALKPDHAEAHNNLGCVLLAQGKRDAASACFERALVLRDDGVVPSGGLRDRDVERRTRRSGRA